NSSRQYSLNSKPQPFERRPLPLLARPNVPLERLEALVPGMLGQTMEGHVDISRRRRKARPQRVSGEAALELLGLLLRPALALGVGTDTGFDRVVHGVIAEALVRDPLADDTAEDRLARLQVGDLRPPFQPILG